jgi:hypothetical protein
VTMVGALDRRRARRAAALADGRPADGGSGAAAEAESPTGRAESPTGHAESRASA